MTDETPQDLHKPSRDQQGGDEKSATIHAYYDEKFARLSDRAKSPLKIIELECETIRDLLKVYEDTKPDSNGS